MEIGVRDREQEIAMVELAAYECKHGGRRRGAFLDRPGHLSSDEGELRRLFWSDKPSDAVFKRDLLDWVAANHAAKVATMAALVTLVKAVHLADRLIASWRPPGEETPDEHPIEYLFELRADIADHVRERFGCDARKAPTDALVLDAWCWAVASKGDPTPAFALARNRGEANLDAARARAASIARAEDE
jgi:hypothetical protein